MSKTFLCKFMLCSEGIQFIFTGIGHNLFVQPASRSLIDDFRRACAVKGNVQVAGRTSSVWTTEMLSTHDVTLRNVDGSLFHVQL